MTQRDYKSCPIHETRDSISVLKDVHLSDTLGIRSQDSRGDATHLLQLEPDGVHEESLIPSNIFYSGAGLFP
jgi:hypothetical protein